MKLFSALFVSVFSGALLAAAADVSGSRDLEALPRFPASHIVAFAQEPAAERIYPQGSVRRISGRLRYEREILAQGRHQAVTYELPGTHSADQVFSASREALLKQGAELLYWCQGRECGSSSLWANAVFGNSTLYGSDDQQAYALLRLAEPNHESLLALYSITRGNRRAYLHAEQLDADAPLGALLPTPATLLRQLRSDGQLQLPVDAKADSAWVEVLARSLNLDSTLRVSLSGGQAPAWREALMAQRVREARLELGEDEGDALNVRLLR
ncbi:DUF4892 domain-containing protein [Pseudomonas sp. REST10]|uniref:DUF4892 domain-containing protein n=1 Tax=Pseudomonas sp. REST10 TaxID=2512235 RepID=UPI00240D95BF|nr:DUF4892 domain-containing protein [Pseudomonas sp. REST10]WFC62415.1 DUF4892 domain-containing protein [Pseudomonas sp. REST10]